MMSARKLMWILAISQIFVTLGCNEADPTNPGTTSDFTISGTIEVVKQLDIPESAQLYAVWIVSSGSPDYAYVFGKGTVDMNAGTFSISFKDALPSDGLNDFNHNDGDSIPKFGVAMLILADSMEVGQKLYEESYTYGAVAEGAVIYINGDPARFKSEDHRPYLSEFPRGYGFGKRKVNGPNTFDSIIPTELNSLKLIISDDWSDYKLPNWT